MAQNYQYTVNCGGLDDAQRDFYETNGYLILRKLISEEDIANFTQQFIDICRGDIKVFGMTIMKDKGVKCTPDTKEEYQVYKIQDITSDVPIFEKYFKNPDLLNMIQSIVGPNITAFNSMILNKPPNSSDVYAVHPTHQDLFYLPMRPVDSVCATWTAMDKCTKENGCLYVIPKSHRSPLLPHVDPDKTKNKSYQGIPNIDERLKVYVEMEPGDTIVFHPLLLHGSGPNTTQVFRRAISGHFVDSNAFFINVRGTLQEDIQRQAQEIYAKKGFFGSYSDMWKTKSRLVCGRPGNLQQVSSNL